MGKISISVLVIWAVVGVSVFTLYPLAETSTNKQFGMDSRNLQPVTNPNNSQSDSDNSQSGVVSGNYQSNGGSGNSQSGVVSGNSQQGIDPGNVGTDPGNGNKYLVDNFVLNLLNFTAEITNPQNHVTGDGFYEIKTNPASNHHDVLQSGTFSHSQGTFTINRSLSFTPTNNTKYHILIYTNYPEHDNRVSKDDHTYIS